MFNLRRFVSRTKRREKTNFLIIRIHQTPCKRCYYRGARSEAGHPSHGAGGKIILQRAEAPVHRRLGQDRAQRASSDDHGSEAREAAQVWLRPLRSARLPSGTTQNRNALLWEQWRCRARAVLLPPRRCLAATASRRQNRAVLRRKRRVCVFWCDWETEIRQREGIAPYQPRFVREERWALWISDSVFLNLQRGGHLEGIWKDYAVNKFVIVKYFEQLWFFIIYSRILKLLGWWY